MNDPAKLSIALTLTLGLGALTACGKTEAAAERLEREASEALQKAEDHLGVTREEVQAALEEGAGRLKDEVAELKSRYEAGEFDRSEEIARLKAELARLKTDLEPKLEELRAKGGDTWERLEREATEEFDRLQRSLDGLLEKR